MEYFQLHRAAEIYAIKGILKAFRIVIIELIGLNKYKYLLG